jgi:hypothetical protein
LAVVNVSTEEKVIHGFTKGDMLSSLDSLSLHIKVQNILHSLGEAKEDTNIAMVNEQKHTLHS